jgi:hypothetical protein
MMLSFGIRLGGVMTLSTTALSMDLTPWQGVLYREPQPDEPLNPVGVRLVPFDLSASLPK